MSQYLLPGSESLIVVELYEKQNSMMPDRLADVDFSDCACSPLPPMSGRNLLDDIKRSFNLNELKTLCFRLGIKSEDLAGDTLIDKARELIEHHERRKRLSALLNELKTERPEVDWSIYSEASDTDTVINSVDMPLAKGFQKEISPSAIVPTITTNSEEEVSNDSKGIAEVRKVIAMVDLEFVNRSREIEYVMNPARAAVMLIDAPAGYGKTAMLQALQEKFEYDKWNCVLVNLGEVQGVVDQKLRGVLKANHDKCVFLFDVVEQSIDADLDWLLGEYLPGCKNSLPSDGFRAIFAGRYIEHNTGAARWVGVEKMHLSPFSQEVVEKMIDKTLARTSGVLEFHQINILAKTIIELSGGHPRSIRNLITTLEKANWTLPITTLEKQEIFRLCTAGEANLVTNELRKETRACLANIFVFRRFNLRTLKFLQQRGVIKSGIDVFQILSDLTQKRLVARKDGSVFYSDQIVRDLILARLRLFEPENYRSFNQAASELYTQWIESELGRPDNEDSPISASDLVPILVVENIYHICQQYSQDISAIEIAATCIKKHGDYLVRALGESSDDPNRQKYLKELMLQDDNSRLVIEERGLSIDVVFDIAFRDYSNTAQFFSKQPTAQGNPVERGDIMTQRNIFDWLVDSLDMLRHNAQNVLIERWEKRNQGKAVTPPVFADRNISPEQLASISREELAETLPKDDVLQRKLNGYQDASGRIVVVNEKYVTTLKKQMEMAQSTIGRYELSRLKPLSESEKIQLEAQIEEYQEKFDEAARKLADIYAYIFSE